MYLGIDVGGTHTDAVLCGEQGRIFSAKVKTQAQQVPLSIRHALQALHDENVKNMGAEQQLWAQVQRVTVSTTLGLNAMVQGKTALVGLVYTAGSGMDPQRFLQSSVMGRFCHRVEGGLDHRGYEVTALDLTSLQSVVRSWQAAGIRYFAVAGKFAVRNGAHEQAIAAELVRLGVARENITLAQQLSGQLNFPRRMAAAYMNASIQEVQQQFLHAVHMAVQDFMRHLPVPPIFFLKSDGGAISFTAAQASPLYTVLSGPAASVMGAMALGQKSLLEAGDALLLDVGGTTTDVAVYASGLPVLDTQGMCVSVPRACMEHDQEQEITVKEVVKDVAKSPASSEREVLRTPLRALATHSLALGGDSPLLYDTTEQRLHLCTVRQGAAMVFGGSVPTLVDALMLLQAAHRSVKDRSVTAEQKVQQKNLEAARAAVQALTCAQGATLQALLQDVVQEACTCIVEGIHALLTRLAGRPVYTLAQLLEEYTLQPQQVCLVGGPAALLQPWLAPLLQEKFGASLHVPACSSYANALGAALTLPTDYVELLADTLQGTWHIPTLALHGTLEKGFTLEHAKRKAQQALQESAAAQGWLGTPRMAGEPYGHCDVTGAEAFATLDEYGRGGKDIRVQCQWRPGIVMAVAPYWHVY